MSELPIYQKAFVVLAMLVTAVLFARIGTKDEDVEDGVSDESDPLYLDRDVLGQPKDWNESEKVADKNNLPVRSRLTVVMAIIAFVIVLILLVVGF